MPASQRAVTQVCTEFDVLQKTVDRPVRQQLARDTTRKGAMQDPTRS